jgi:hypothetical protein
LRRHYTKGSLKVKQKSQAKQSIAQKSARTLPKQAMSGGKIDGRHMACMKKMQLRNNFASMALLCHWRVADFRNKGYNLGCRM